MEHVNEVISLINKQKPKLVSVSEITHRSKTSHDLHKKIYIELAKKKLINNVSSELLGIIDGYLINKYVNGKINDNLTKLNFNCGIGSIDPKLIKKYNETNKNKINVVGFEIDVLHDRSYMFKKYIKKKISKELGNKIEKYFSLTEHIYNKNIEKTLDKLLNELIKYQKLIKTKFDKFIYDAIKLMIKRAYSWFSINKYENIRYKIWYSNIKKFIKNDNVIIFGYHLAKNDLKFKEKFISIGMCSYKLYYDRIIKLNMIPPKFENQKQFLLFYNKYIIPKIINKNYTAGYIDKYLKPTDIEKYMYTNNKILMSVSELSKMKIYDIRQVGSDLIIFKKVPLTSKHKFKYDYILFTKKSKTY